MSHRIKLETRLECLIGGVPPATDTAPGPRFEVGARVRTGPTTTGKIVQAFEQERQVELDGTGRQVWLECDQLVEIRETPRHRRRHSLEFTRQPARK